LREEFLREAPEAVAFPDFESVAPMSPVGCPKCDGTGYKGRVALHELLMATPSIKDAVRKKGDAALLKQRAREEGMLPLKMDGILKVLQGLTDMEQVLKVCM
jgi:type II secretory ATPase GspE/PulE/Tfp pilus assembly ATPase PilB-like protein